MEPYNHCLNCEWWTGEVCECPPGVPCHSEEEEGDEALRLVEACAAEPEEGDA